MSFKNLLKKKKEKERKGEAEERANEDGSLASPQRVCAVSAVKEAGSRSGGRGPGNQPNKAGRWVLVA